MPGDLPRVAEIIRSANLEYASAMPDGRWERYVERASDLESRLSDTTLLVAELDGRLVGTLTVYERGERSPGENWPVGWVGLRLLAVDPDGRGYGVGRALMEASIKRARALGASAVALHTMEYMSVARAMYERMGFERIPEHESHTGSGRTVLAYCLPLREPAQT